MKNIFLSLLLVFSLTIPRSSKAAVGLSYASFGISLIGVGVLGLGGAATYGGLKMLKQGTTGKILIGIALFGVALGAGWFGLLTLDGDESASPEFSALSEKDALALGVSEEERLSYNSELDQLNAVNVEIAGQIEGEKSEIAVRKAASLWADYKDSLSSGTFEVLVKIASQAQ